MSEALSEEGVITKALRSEIITMIALGMWQHSSYPTPEEYTSVCRELVLKYPVLKDTHGNGYVSCVVVGGHLTLSLKAEAENMH